MSSAWQMMAQRFPAYDLVVPGTPTFKCLVAACTEHCCNRYTVNLSDRDVDRVARYSGLSPRDFLECEDGGPLALPLAQPYVLARAHNTCVFLGEDMACQQYEGRPNACRLYPHFVLFVDADTGNPTYGDIAAIGDSFRDSLAGRPSHLVPVLMRHIACPGFEGDRLLPEDEWFNILRETARIQYAPDVPGDWPMSIGVDSVTAEQGDRLFR